MQGNRKTDTKPEVRVRAALHRRGLRFRKNLTVQTATGPVRPDVVFPGARVAVFIDGCFWHCCPEHGNQPTTNAWYWGPKLDRNVARDRRVDLALQTDGWTVLRVWTHEEVHIVADRVADLIKGTA